MQPTSRPFIGSKVPAADRDRSSPVFICNSLAGSHASGSGTSAWFEFDGAAYCKGVSLRSPVRLYSLAGSASIGSRTVALRSAQRWTIKYIAGKTNNMRIADVTIPPTTTRANGFLGFRADARRNGRRKQADIRSECSHQYRAQLQFGAFSNGIA